MKLTIICPRITRDLRELISLVTSYTGITNWDLIDPVSFKIEAEYYPVVLLLGDVQFNSDNARIWWRTHLPSREMILEDKQEMTAVFHKVSEYIKQNKDPSGLLDTEIPKIKNLEEWIKTQYGSVISVKLVDGRTMGVYPDGKQPQNKHDIEIHYSTLINFEKIFRILKAKEVLVRDL